MSRHQKAHFPAVLKPNIQCNTANIALNTEKFSSKYIC